MPITQKEGDGMKPIKDEQDRLERIAAVKRQLGSPKTSPKKARDLNKYLKKLMYARSE